MCAALPRRPQGSVHEGESAGSSVAGGVTEVWQTMSLGYLTLAMVPCRSSC